MDFELSEEQRSLRRSIVEFARRELNEDVVQRDKTATFSREAWAMCADFGLLGLPVPKKYGGVGANVLTTVIALEALGYACADNGLVVSLNAQMWAWDDGRRSGFRRLSANDQPGHRTRSRGDPCRPKSRSRI